MITSIATRSGPCVWIARRWALFNASVTLHFAERDRDLLAWEVENKPKKLKALDLDIAAMRVQIALLRSGRA